MLLVGRRSRKNCSSMKQQEQCLHRVDGNTEKKGKINAEKKGKIFEKKTERINTKSR